MLALGTLSAGALHAQAGPNDPRGLYEAGCRREDDECARDVSRPIIGVAQAPALFNNVQLSSHEFLASAVQFDQDKLKLVVTPFKLRPERKALSSLTFNLARQDKSYTLGVGAGYDRADPLGTRGDTLVRRVFRTVRAAQGAEITNPDAYLDAVWRPAYRDYYHTLLKNSWSLSLGGNLLLFEDLGGREVDRDNNGVIDNKHSFKGFTLTPSATYNFSFRTGLGASYYFSRKRGGTAADEDLVNYHGGSFTFSHRTWILDEKYWESSDFITDFFVPSVDLGFAAETEWCTADEESEEACEDEIKQEWALTPFVDIRVSPKAQFRLGLAVRRSTLIKGVPGEDETAVGPILQYVLQLGPSK
jgi:hypothetical protein